MLKRPITYTDFNDVERTEDFYFNLTEAELLKMELGKAGGYSEMLSRIVATDDRVELTKIFDEIIIKSYGEKSGDGKSFIKSDELLAKFKCTAAYSALFTELMTNTDAAIEFVNGIMPKRIREQMDNPDIQKTLAQSVKGFPEVNNQ